MWYFITGLICAVLIWLNNKERNAPIVKYIVISILFPQLGYGLWQAEKPLIGNEERYGGKGWNIMKWFAIFHTIFCVIWAVYGLVVGSDVASKTNDDFGRAGAVIGTGLGIIMIMMVWFGGVLGSLILGLILKKPIVEKAGGETKSN